MPQISRAQLAVYAAAAIALVLIGANYLRGHASVPAPDPPRVHGGGGKGAPPLQTVGASGGPGPAAPASGGPAVVHVVGAVRRPGVYRFPATARVEDAVRRAGGPTGRANLAGVNLAARVSDGSQVVVPLRGRGAGVVGAPGAQGASAVPAKGAKKGGKGAGGGPAAPVNLNAATAEELMTLNGVGPATAQKIIAYREAHGPFRTVDDLGQVSGIGPKKLEALRPYVQI